MKLTVKIEYNGKKRVVRADSGDEAIAKVIRAMAKLTGRSPLSLIYGRKMVEVAAGKT